MLSPAEASLLGERRTFRATLAMAVWVMGASSSAATSCARPHSRRERHHPGQQQQNKRAKKTLHLNERLLYSWLGLAEMETAHAIL